MLPNKPEKFEAARDQVLNADNEDDIREQALNFLFSRCFSSPLARGQLKEIAISGTQPYAGRAALELALHYKYQTNRSVDWQTWHQVALDLNEPQALYSELVYLTEGRRNHEHQTPFSFQSHSYAVELQKRLEQTGDSKFNQKWAAKSLTYGVFPFCQYYSDLDTGQQLLQDNIEKAPEEQSSHAKRYCQKMKFMQEKIQLVENEELPQGIRAQAALDLSRLYVNVSPEQWLKFHNKALELQHPIAIGNELNYILQSRRNHVDEHPVANLQLIRSYVGRLRELVEEGEENAHAAQEQLDGFSDSISQMLKVDALQQLFLGSEEEATEVLQTRIKALYDVASKKLLLKHYGSGKLFENFKDILKSLDVYGIALGKLNKDAQTQLIDELRDQPMTMVIADQRNTLAYYSLLKIIHRVNDTKLNHIETKRGFLGKRTGKTPEVIKELREMFQDFELKSMEQIEECLSATRQIIAGAKTSNPALGKVYREIYEIIGQVLSSEVTQSEAVEDVKAEMQRYLDRGL